MSSCIKPGKDYTWFRTELKLEYCNEIQEQKDRKSEAKARRGEYKEQAEKDPVALVFDQKANPHKRKRDEAVRTLKTIWKNVKTEELRFRSIKITAAEKVLGEVCGAVETIKAMGFEDKDGKRLFKDMNSTMEAGEKVYKQLQEGEKKDPPLKMRPWRANWIIKDFLCLGSEEEAKNYDGLKEHGITHILNVADNVDCYFRKSREFRYKQLKVKDFGKDRGISRAFPDAIKFLQMAQKAGGKCLIHCFAGQNRSVTCTVAFVMDTERISLLKAWRIVKHARPLASPFLDNRRQLIQYEKKTRGVNTMRITDFNISYGGETYTYNYQYRYGYGYGYHYGYQYGY